VGVDARRALIDGKVTCTYEDGDTVLVDFQRDAGHTEVLTGGNRFGQAGVSIMDKFQAIVDTMNDAEFGGLPVQVEMGGGVWAVIRKDAEILANLDKYRPVGGVEIERGVATSGDRSKRYKVGEDQIGGGSGQVIELFVNNEPTRPTTARRFATLATNEMVFLATPETIMGYECFGMIVDRDAQYQALPIFPKNFSRATREGRAPVVRVGAAHGADWPERHLQADAADPVDVCVRVHDKSMWVGEMPGVDAARFHDTETHIRFWLDDLPGGVPPRLAVVSVAEGEAYRLGEAYDPHGATIDVTATRLSVSEAAGLATP
jgi:hypothetical protein